ncbi:Quinolinate synthase A [Desulfotomaculum nigrificans CO-1-SRB]|uniref:Quinolinate synthase n=1 Tax=Desulfotomaculum nigrificans (strain DSM 14880 / VKM B-2319 / CO-1-SRB) TaxID=868595 RepID=F6B541_DESCC|nr:quinolinate synthase NadA [Desulfotomaculum nigrificans]AEF93060.1 Quinolinate synthase A [Desulfotomaculum nigrificans CO-1-SRB]
MFLEEKTIRLTEEIKRLKKERNAIILAHVYQRPEVQEVADIIGDSLELSRKAAATDADVIVFCGVHFMAESAAILSPDKIVLLPEETAGCPMADMVTAEQLRAKKKEMPDAVVVAYVNTSAEVKAESDICCTSANAVKIVQSIPADKRIIFIPDKNLGMYVANRTGRPMTLWEGWCNTHDWVTPEEVARAKEEHPEALVLIHPECRPEVTAMADYVSSTTGLIRFAKESDAKEFIVGTESGILHQLYKQCPGKEFYLATRRLVCPNMKATNLEKVRQALATMQPQITVAPDIREKALACLERMLAVK